MGEKESTGIKALESAKGINVLASLRQSAGKEKKISLGEPAWYDEGKRNSRGRYTRHSGLKNSDLND